MKKLSTSHLGPMPRKVLSVSKKIFTAPNTIFYLVLLSLLLTQFSAPRPSFFFNAPLA